MINNISQNTQEKISLQEDNAIFVGGTVAIFSLLFSLFSLIMSSLHLQRKIKVNKRLSEKINEVLQTGNKWVVHVLSFKQPNAFSLGIGRHIYITTSLLKLLNERETIAVLLHEVYHSTKKHSLKYIVVRSTFIGIVIAVLAEVLFATPFGLLVIIILNYTFNVLWTISISRLMETKADSYATKYGYGHDLISALRKIQRWFSQRANRYKCTVAICKIIQKLKNG